MELGGKSPFVVFADADFDRALDAAVFMIFSNNGERCTAGSRILVQQSIHDRFAQEFALRAERIAVGDPLDEATIVGPMISKEHLAKVRQYIELGPAEGATLLAGGLLYRLLRSEQARLAETRRGAAADSLRYRMQASTEADRRKYLETFLSQSLGSFSLRGFEFQGLEDGASDLVLSYDILAPAYAKRAGGYLVLRPRVVGIKAIDLASRDRKPRRHPIDLETTLLARDEFSVELPPGWTVEGLPAPVELEAGFAAYRSLTEVDGGRVVYRREYRVTESVIPAARFDRALEFFLAVGAEEQRSLLLKTGGEGR